MNAIVNKLLFAGDKFMPRLHWRQPGFTYRTCGPFVKIKKKLKKQMVQGIFIKMHQIELVFNVIWHMEVLKI